MGFLGDFFPEKIRNEYAESQIKCGSVIFLHDDVAGKDKYHVIVGFDQGRVLAATVRINSEINQNVYDTPEKRSMCHQILEKDIDFLDHDSVVACDKLISWDRRTIETLVNSDPKIALGTLPQGELELVQYKISTAPTISKKTKRSFGLLLE